MASKDSKAFKIVAKNGLDDLKLETAREIGVPLVKGYDGNLASRLNGSAGGHMVKSMMENYEKNLIGK